MRFGNVDYAILFGGGELLSKFALKLKKENVKFLVVTSERHSKEDIRTGSEVLNFKKFLAKNKIKHLISKDVNKNNKIIDKITDKTIGISMGAAWQFTGSFIKRFDGKLLNIHGSRLPQDRGGGGFSWQILRKNRLGFSVIHQIGPGIDDGAIVMYKEFFYPPSSRIPRDYRECYIKNNYDMLNEFWEGLKNGANFKCIEQQEYFSTYWPRLSTEVHGFIDWGWPLRDLESFICAFDEPYKGASSFINDNRVFLKNCLSDFSDGVFHPFQKGIVYRKTADALYIAAGEGSLIVRKVEDTQGRNILEKIKIGDRFYTPDKFLERAKGYRAVYTAKGLSRQ